MAEALDTIFTTSSGGTQSRLEELNDPRDFDICNIDTHEGIDIITAGEGNAQQCPSCKIRIKTTAGCHGMTCTECETKFCLDLGKCSQPETTLRQVAEDTADRTITYEIPLGPDVPAGDEGVLFGTLYNVGAPVSSKGSKCTYTDAEVNEHTPLIKPKVFYPGKSAANEPEDKGLWNHVCKKACNYLDGYPLLLIYKTIFSTLCLLVLVHVIIKMR